MGVTPIVADRKTPLTIIHIAARWRPGSPEMNTNVPVFARGPDRSVEGTWGADFYDPVKPAVGEVVITKRSVSPFIGTELDRFLRVRDINTIVCAGGGDQLRRDASLCR